MKKITSPEHEAIGNRIALKQGPMSKENKNLASGERKKVDGLPTIPNLGGIVPVARFTSEEHQAIGNTIEFNKVPKGIATFSSDEHRIIGNVIDFKKVFGDKSIPGIISVEHKEGGDVALRRKIDIRTQKNRQKNMKEIEKVGEDCADGSEKVAEGLIQL